jgi:hypothetical protein
MSFSLKTPPPIVGQVDPTCCWAAALESWQSAVGVPGKLRQSELVRRYSGTGMSVATFKRNAEYWEMNFNTVSLANFPPTPELEHGLIQFGYFFLAFKWPDDEWWHCNVLYGVATSKSDEPHYLVMDPGYGGSLMRRVKSDFFQASGTGLFLGWHKKLVRGH